MNSKNAVIDGTAEVISPLFTATLTTIAVFVPVIMLDGVTGFFFKASSTTIVVALSLSLILAIFFIPILMSFSFGRQLNIPKKPVKKDSPNAFMAVLCQEYSGTQDLLFSSVLL